MKLKFTLLAIAAMLSIMGVNAQAKQPHRAVNNLEIIDLKNDPAILPYWGEKNLLIFYVDPDSYISGGQNKEFTDNMESSKRAEGENIYGFGIINLKDSWLPNGIVRKVAAARTKKNNALIMADKNLSIATKWGLGDCDNQFVMIIISKEGKLVYYYKGQYTPEAEEEFYSVVDKYR